MKKKKKIQYSKLFDFLKQQFKWRKRVKERKHVLTEKIINTYKAWKEIIPMCIFQNMNSTLQYLSDSKNIRSFRKNKRKKKRKERKEINDSTSI